MTVMPSMVIALWSDGPAPPRRLSCPAFGSTSRTPQDCNSLISCAVGMALGVVNFIGRIPIWYVVNGARQGFGQHWLRGTIVEHELEKLGTGIVADRVHHPLALDDQTHVEIGDEHAP